MGQVFDSLREHDEMVRNDSLTWLGEDGPGYLGMIEGAFGLNMRLLDRVAEASTRLYCRTGRSRQRCC